MRRVRFCVDEHRAGRGARAQWRRRRGRHTAARRGRARPPRLCRTAGPGPTLPSALVSITLFQVNYEKLHHVQNNLRDKEKTGNFLN